MDDGQEMMALALDGECACRRPYLKKVLDAEQRLSRHSSLQTPVVRSDIADAAPLSVSLPDGTDASWLLVIFAARGRVRFLVHHHVARITRSGDAVDAHVHDDGSGHAEERSLFQAELFLLRHFVPQLDDVVRRASLGLASPSGGGSKR